MAAETPLSQPSPAHYSWPARCSETCRIALSYRCNILEIIVVFDKCFFYEKDLFGHVFVNVSLPITYL